MIRLLAILLLVSLAFPTDGWAKEPEVLTGQGFDPVVSKEYEEMRDSIRTSLDRLDAKIVECNRPESYSGLSRSKAIRKCRAENIRYRDQLRELKIRLQAAGFDFADEVLKEYEEKHNLINGDKFSRYVKKKLDNARKSSEGYTKCRSRRVPAGRSCESLYKQMQKSTKELRMIWQEMQIEKKLEEMRGETDSLQ